MMATTFGYGFGWFVDKVKGHTHISHSGGIPGFTSHLTRFPDDKLTVVVLTNQMGNTPRIGEGVAGLYLPAIAPPTYKPIEDKEPQVTAQVKKIMEQLAEGNLDKEQFTPALAACHLHAVEGRSAGWPAQNGADTNIRFVGA